jgi:ABC-type transport system involved in multi-copper enzyme maturation permease subunit
MRGFLTIARLTVHEAARRRILLAALILGLAFLVLFAVGFHFIGRDVARHGATFLQRRMALTFLALAGLYAVNFLMVMTEVLLPVDALSGEIASGVMQTIASKPIRRAEIVLGKWAAYVLLVAGYTLLMAGGVLAVAWFVGRHALPNVHLGLPLMLLEGVVLVSLVIAGGARLSTIANGVTVFGLYGLAFIGSWVEQIGALTQNTAAQQVGVVASLLMPTEAMWQLAAHHMQPALMSQLGLTPFSPLSVPSALMVWWAVGYALVMVLLAVAAFRRRGL